MLKNFFMTKSITISEAKVFSLQRFLKNFCTISLYAISLNFEC